MVSSPVSSEDEVKPKKKIKTTSSFDLSDNEKFKDEEDLIDDIES